ncbi:GtrA family protein [Lacisediminihabitans sp. H27-G8]|uniref:GtrA family protein n=1 Tax=Lacisediminihabitans sp. H27-G8 TaxID=3111909 RepID=UPI0038FCC84E
MRRLTVRAAFASPAFRFLLVGGSNTLATGLLVVALSLILPGWLAFTIAFALGICFSVFVTGRWVFSSHVSLRRAGLYIAAYLAIYLVGLVVIAALKSWGAPPVANLATIVVTAPLSFLAGKFIFTNPSPEEQQQ